MASTVSLGESQRTIQDLLEGNPLYQENKSFYDKIISAEQKSRVVTNLEIKSGYVFQGIIEIAKRVALVAIIVLTVPGMSTSALIGVVGSGVISACLGNDQLRSKFSQIKWRAELFACLPPKLKVISGIARTLIPNLAVVAVAVSARYANWLAIGVRGVGLFAATQMLMEDVLHVGLLGVEKWHDSQVRLMEERFAPYQGG